MLAIQMAFKRGRESREVNIYYFVSITSLVTYLSIATQKLGSFGGGLGSLARIYGSRSLTCQKKQNTIFPQIFSYH
jgi:hypothetical protein